MITIQELLKRDGRWYGGEDPKDITRRNFARFCKAWIKSLCASFGIPERILREPYNAK